MVEVNAIKIHTKANIKTIAIKVIITKVIKVYIITHAEIPNRAIIMVNLEAEAVVVAEVITMDTVTVGTIHLLATLTTSSTSSGAMGLLATSFTTTWPSLAITSRINHESHDEDHGTASLEISLSLITSMTRYKVRVPRITGHSDISGSSITKAT